MCEHLRHQVISISQKRFTIWRKRRSPIQAPAARAILSIYIERRLADLEKKINNAGAKWAGIEEGKAEMKKVHHAEKELDKAKRRLEAVRKGRRKESRFESENSCIFFIDLLENDQLKGSRYE